MILSLINDSLTGKIKGSEDNRWRVSIGVVNLQNGLDQGRDIYLEMIPTDEESEKFVRRYREKFWWRGITMRIVRKHSKGERNGRCMGQGPKKLPEDYITPQNEGLRVNLV